MQPALPEESLDMGTLQQVIEDEELARQLQDEEEKQLRRVTDQTVDQDVLGKTSEERH